MTEEERKEFRKTHPYEPISKTGDFVDETLERNYQTYVNRKLKKGQIPKQRLEWKKASDYWSKESPVARGNDFNKTVQEADIYDYHDYMQDPDVLREQYKKLDDGEVIDQVRRNEIKNTN